MANLGIGSTSPSSQASSTAATSPITEQAKRDKRLEIFCQAKQSGNYDQYGNSSKEEIMTQAQEDFVSYYSQKDSDHYTPMMAKAIQLSTIKKEDEKNDGRTPDLEKGLGGACMFKYKIDKAKNDPFTKEKALPMKEKVEQAEERLIKYYSDDKTDKDGDGKPDHYDPEKVDMIKNGKIDDRYSLTIRATRNEGKNKGLAGLSSPPSLEPETVEEKEAFKKQFPELKDIDPAKGGLIGIISDSPISNSKTINDVAVELDHEVVHQKDLRNRDIKKAIEEKGSIAEEVDATTSGYQYAADTMSDEEAKYSLTASSDPETFKAFRDGHGKDPSTQARMFNQFMSGYLSNRKDKAYEKGLLDSPLHPNIPEGIDPKLAAMYHRYDKS